MSELEWIGGDPECLHEHREATVEGSLGCVTCGALLLEAGGDELPAQVTYVLRGRLGGAQVCGEWHDPKLAGLAAMGIRAHGGRATILKVTTEEVLTGVGGF